MLVLLLGLTLAVPAATSGTRLELDASTSYTETALDTHEQFPAGPVPLSARWQGGGAGLALDVFARRLVDDDAAPPLQAFLQRATRVHLDGGGAGAAATYPILVVNPVEPSSAFVQPSATESSGYVDASAEGYPGRWLFVGGGVGFRQTTRSFAVPLGDPAVYRLPPALRQFVRAIPLFVEAGVRWRELRILAGWSVTPTQVERDDFSVPFWGGAFAQADLVVRRFVALSTRLTVGDGGASVDASTSIWLRRRLGLMAAVGGGRVTGLDSVGGAVGVQYWLSGRLALALAYAPAWQRVTPGRYDSTSDSSVSHLLTLTLTSRPR